MNPNVIVTLFVIGAFVFILGINFIYNRYFRKVQNKESWKEVLANAFGEFILFMIFVGITRLFK